MIPLELPWLVFLWLFVFLCGILLVWAVVDISRRRAMRRSMRDRLQCACCSFIYTDPTGDPLPKCPRCGSLNERTPPRIF